LIDQERKSGWSEAERQVMALTDHLYEELAAQGRRRPARAAVRVAARELGEGIEAVYRQEADGRNWRRACRAAANELSQDAHEALATLAVAGSDMARGIAGAERRRASERRERGLMDALFAEVRALRAAKVSGADTAEALYRLDPGVVLGCLEGERPFGAALLGRHGAERVGDMGELARALLVAASPVARVRELRPEVAAMRHRVDAGELKGEEAIPELRSRASRRSRRRGESEPRSAMVAELPEPSQRDPERVWEFPAFEELAEAMRPALPAGEEAEAA
jgi:hypothetical protein